MLGLFLETRSRYSASPAELPLLPVILPPVSTGDSSEEATDTNDPHMVITI